MVPGTFARGLWTDSTMIQGCDSRKSGRQGLESNGTHERGETGIGLPASSCPMKGLRQERDPVNLRSSCFILKQASQ
jgi:hypothetical protein